MGKLSLGKFFGVICIGSIRGSRVFEKVSNCKWKIRCESCQVSFRGSDEARFLRLKASQVISFSAQSRISGGCPFNSRIRR